MKSTRTQKLQKRLVKSSQETSVKQPLTLQELSQVVPLFITPDLQNQVRFLCKEIWNDEWSGMLFYETEGEFGDENFKVIAKGLFLLDIGNKTYTEYDPGDPDLIKFLMANPEALALKKGHIHSHNNMDVFFSGTDNSELVDNCEFHNFYVSLIVNNRNEMCAKIAFKAKSTSENHLTISYLNQEGKEKQKKLVGKKESDNVYVYKCEIFKPGEVEDSFKSRFQEVKEAKEAKEKAKKALGAAYKNGSYVGFNIDDRWRQAGLFDDVKGSSILPKGKEKDGIVRSKDYREPMVTGGKRTSVVERAVRTDPRVYTMLSKLLSLDFLYEGTLSRVIEKLDNGFFPQDESFTTLRAPYELHQYCDQIETRATEFYIDAFPEDCHKLVFFDSIMERCIEILESYEDEYPELISNLTEALNLEIKK